MRSCGIVSATGSSDFPAGVRPPMRTGTVSSTAMTYQHADFDDPAAYAQLSDYLTEIDAHWNTKANRLFYLATPPGCLA